MMNQFDTNRSGDIQFEEFVDMMTGVNSYPNPNI